jgi:hypothetical protein
MNKYLEILYYIKVEKAEIEVKTRKSIEICFFLYCCIFIVNQYKVTVYTGNKRGAGTDADVFIILYGDLGKSGAILLDNKKNNFEAGKYVLR